MLVQIKPIPVNVNIEYAPTREREEEEINNFYALIKNILREEVLIIMDDFNAKV